MNAKDRSEALEILALLAELTEQEVLDEVELRELGEWSKELLKRHYRL